MAKQEDRHTTGPLEPDADLLETRAVKVLQPLDKTSTIHASAGEAVMATTTSERRPANELRAHPNA